MSVNPYYAPYWSDASSDELEHFGILGMKWGIRRYQNKDGSLTKAGKERYGAKNISDIEPTVIKGQRYDRDITFSKGTVGYRVSSKPNIDLNTPVYLSYDKKDHVTYFGLAISHPDYGISADARETDGGSLKDLYSLELKAKEPIKAPSYQHAMETFVEMVSDIGIDKINPYDSKTIGGQRFIDSFFKGYYTEYYGSKQRKETISEIKGDFAYKKFVDTLRKPSRSEFYKEFTKRLADKGYNALVDPEDRAYEADPKEDWDDYGYGFTSPFIILDPKKTLSVSKSTKLTEADKQYLAAYGDTGMGINARDATLKNNPNSWINNDEEMKKTHEKWKKWYNS